jgi:hypothetical protein
MGLSLVQLSLSLVSLLEVSLSRLKIIAALSFLVFLPTRFLRWMFSCLSVNRKPVTLKLNLFRSIFLADPHPHSANNLKVFECYEMCHRIFVIDHCLDALLVRYVAHVTLNSQRGNECLPSIRSAHGTFDFDLVLTLGEFKVGFRT